MPKRRVPGHVYRAGRGRRRTDVSRPLPPIQPAPAAPLDMGAAESSAEGLRPAVPGPIPAPAGRPLRPTLRQAAGGRLVRSATPTEPEVDYGQVIGDLRQIGVLAGLAFLILIGLAFVIR